MIYRLVRAVISFALGLFYKIEVVRRESDLRGPVMFVGNHPNSLIDPAMVFVITDRQVTFLAREPLFRVPVLGWLLRGIDALPVFRKQDNPALMQKNDATLEAAAGALTAQRAITIFPEGKSHSDPELSEVKTGCARIALRVAKQGLALRIVPIGLTYEQKHRFRSTVHVEVGEPILVEAFEGHTDVEDQQWVRSLTAQVETAMRSVTINLESWEDLELINTADQLFALRNGYREKDPERLRLFAKGASLLRDLDIERFDDLKEDILSYRARLDVVRADPEDASVKFEKSGFRLFVARNLAALIFGFPLYALGIVLFFIPFLLLRGLALAAPVSRDRIATLKFTSALLMVPLWWTLLTVAGWWLFGIKGLVIVLFGALPLALFTRYFVERRRAAFHDLFAFFKIGDRRKLRDYLITEGDRLQDEIQRAYEELKSKL